MKPSTFLQGQTLRLQQNKRKKGINASWDASKEKKTISIGVANHVVGRDNKAHF